MEDKPTADSPKKAGENDTAQGPVQPLQNKEEATHTGKDAEHDKDKPEKEENPKSRWVRFKAWVFPIDFSDVVMLLLTTFIALGTIVSAAAIVLQWREMVNGEADTTAIKVAAQQQAKAADRFAVSAGNINTEIGNAVGKLNLQAAATKSIADQALKQAITAREAFEAESRPYLDGMIEVDPKGAVSHFLSYPIELVNTGRIPAEMISLRRSIFVSGIRIPITEKHANKRILDPGGKADLPERLSEPAASEVRSGRADLLVYFAYSYRWRNEHESRCQKWQYDPKSNRFLDLGEECPPS